MGFFSSFAKSFSSASSSAEENHTKNSFAGTVHTPPPKETKTDSYLRKSMKNNNDILEVMEDDEFTKDMERMVKYADSAYGTQQKHFREAVLEKYEEEDGWYTCAHCGKRFRKPKVHADHVIPKSKGGSFSVDNGQVLCAKCNTSKNDSQDQTDEDLARIQKEKELAKEADEEFLESVNKVLKSNKK